MKKQQTLRFSSTNDSISLSQSRLQHQYQLTTTETRKSEKTNPPAPENPLRKSLTLRKQAGVDGGQPSSIYQIKRSSTRLLNKNAGAASNRAYAMTPDITEPSTNVATGLTSPVNLGNLVGAGEGLRFREFTQGAELMTKSKQLAGGGGTGTGRSKQIMMLHNSRTGNASTASQQTISNSQQSQQHHRTISQRLSQIVKTPSALKATTSTTSHRVSLKKPGSRFIPDKLPSSHNNLTKTQQAQQQLSSSLASTINNNGILEQNQHTGIAPTPLPPSILSDVDRRKREYDKKWGPDRKKRSMVEFNLENMDGESSSQPTTARNKPPALPAESANAAQHSIIKREGSDKAKKIGETSPPPKVETSDIDKEDSSEVNDRVVSEAVADEEASNEGSAHVARYNQRARAMTQLTQKLLLGSVASEQSFMTNQKSNRSLVGEGGGDSFLDEILNPSNAGAMLSPQLGLPGIKASTSGRNVHRHTETGRLGSSSKRNKLGTVQPILIQKNRDEGSHHRASVLKSSKSRQSSMQEVDKASRESLTASLSKAFQHHLNDRKSHPHNNFVAEKFKLGEVRDPTEQSKSPRVNKQSTSRSSYEKIKSDRSSLLKLLPETKITKAGQHKTVRSPIKVANGVGGLVGSPQLAGGTIAHQRSPLQPYQRKTTLHQMSRQLFKYDAQIEYIKQQMLDNEMTHVICNRKIDRILKQKYALVQEIQQKERTLQYLKEREIKRKEMNLPEIPLTVEKGQLGFGKSAASQRRKAQKRAIALNSKSQKILQKKSVTSSLDTDSEDGQKDGRLENKLASSSSRSPPASPRLAQNQARSSGKLCIMTHPLSPPPRALNDPKTTNADLRSMGQKVLSTTSEVSEADETKRTAPRQQSLTVDKRRRSHQGVGDRLIEDLNTMNLSQKIPILAAAHSSANFSFGGQPQQSRQIVRKPGSSLPQHLTLRDAATRSLQSVRISSKHGQIVVQDLDGPDSAKEVEDQAENTATQTAEALKEQKLLKISKLSQKQNKYIERIHKLHTDVKRASVPDLFQNMSPAQIHTEISEETEEDLNTETSREIMTIPTGVSAMSVGKLRQRGFTTFEHHLKSVAQRGEKQPGGINMKILDLITRPEMAKFPDYPKTAINACRTEVKTLAHEIKNCMSRNANIMALESKSLHSEHIKNEKIELIPRLSIQCKVSIKERIAPLRLKFEFFDSQSGKRIKNPDTIVCISPTIECPEPQNALITKSDFTDPYVVLYREIQDKVIPEFVNGSAKKDRHPQTVYISLRSTAGCLCTITVSFPCEKKVLARQLSLRPNLAYVTPGASKTIVGHHSTSAKAFQTAPLHQLNNTHGHANNQKTKMEKHFMEIKDIIKGPASKNYSYRAGYNMKSQFIQEEIKRCSESTHYVAQIMKLAEDRKKTVLDRNKQLRRQRNEKRAQDCQDFQANFVRKQTQVFSDDNHDLEAAAGNLPKQTLSPQPRSQQTLSLSPDDRGAYIQHLKRKREVNSIHAKETRQSLFEEKQKKRALYVVKRELVAAFKKSEYDRTNKELRVKKLTGKWARILAIWQTLKRVYDHYSEMRQRKEDAKRRTESAAVLVRNARRFFTNKDGERGRTFVQRLQTKISFSVLPVYYVRRDQAEQEAKARLLRFLEATSVIDKLDRRIRLVTHAAKRIAKNWWFYKFRFRIRQAILRLSLMHQMQIWQKMALVAPISKLITKEDKNDMMCCSQKIQEHPDILKKNLILFAKMIKYEQIMRKMQIKIKTEKCDAMRKLEALEGELAEDADQPMSHQRSNWYQSGLPKIAFKHKDVEEICSSSSSDSESNPRRSSHGHSSLQNAQEESKREPKETTRRLREEETEGREEYRRVYRVAKHRRLIKRRLLAKLARLEKQETSGFYLALEREQTKVIKEVTDLKEDRSNFAVCCWKDMDDYAQIRKNAISFKAKAKALKEKHTKDSAAKLKQLRSRYSKEQGAEVKASFRRYQLHREGQFKTALAAQVKANQCANEEQAGTDADGMTSQVKLPGRETQGEELALLLLKVMDEIDSHRLREQLKSQRTVRPSMTNQ